MNLLRKLADSGQAIMCTIHQPSGMILEMFDRLLVLSEGREIYFGDIGTNSRTLIDYFERAGANTCDPDGNPAEWLLDLLASGSNPEVVINWADVWSTSEERSRIIRDAAEFKSKLKPLIPTITSPKSEKDEFPVSALDQLYFVTMRTLRHDWRSPAFLWSKALTTFIIVSRYVSSLLFVFHMESGTNVGSRPFSMVSPSGNRPTRCKASKTSFSPSSSYSMSLLPTCNSL